MLELRRPLLRVLDWPGLKVQRLATILPRPDLSRIDTEEILTRIAAMEPDYHRYFGNQTPACSSSRPDLNEEGRDERDD